MEAREYDEIAGNILKRFKIENNKYPPWVEDDDVCLYRVIKQELKKFLDA